MNCSEVRELAGAQLWGDRRAAFVEHVASCQDCADALLDHQVAAVLTLEPADTKRIEQHVRHEIRSEHRRRMGALAAAAVVLLAVGIGYSVRKNEPIPAIMTAAARDHRMEVVEGQPRHWRTDAPELDTIAARFNLTAADLNRMAPEHFRLEHAKICGLDSTAALHAVYSDGKTSISIYVAPGSGRDVSGTSAAEPVASARKGQWTAIAVGGDCERIARHAAETLKG